ncbi:MAG: DUF2279 domain-containing protein [Bacteroidetes bacterium]|nr:DUF2279 domain-containing protein [Bacteroidota bacterium]
MKYLIIFIFIFFCKFSFGGNDSTATRHPGRIWSTSLTGTVAYTGSVILLNNQWYKDYPRTRFHLFDDSGEWLQMDKAAHVFDGYQLSRAGEGIFRYCGMDKNKAAWFGTLPGFIALSTIEIFDGFSGGWGFSVYDMAANLAGGLMYAGQQEAWDEQRVFIKYSFHKTTYAQYRPGLLGSNMAENILKDYNGQTYWLSCNIPSFLGKENRFPRWLNIAFGYAAEGMTGGHANPDSVSNVAIPFFPRSRQYFFSLDVDFGRIKTNSKILSTVFSVINTVKIPFPAVEYNSRYGVKFYPFYF